MDRWRAIMAGAAAGGALVLAGCAGSQQGARTSRPLPASSPAAASPASRPGSATPSAAASPAGAAAVSLRSSALVPFTGDVVTLTVQASTSSDGLRWLRLASATLSLGDGASATVTGRCAGASLPPPGSGLLVRHTYAHPGVVSPEVTAASVCGRRAQPGLAGSSVSMRVLPAAPAASASWPRCGTSQVAATATGTGAGLGHVGVLFTLRNTSSAACRLYGYPGLLLLGSHGQALPTTVIRAVHGAYLFPAVTPHWVALPPGAVGSFDLQYGDNPVGAQANEPYATACPSATHVEVTLPDAPDHSIVPASLSPCGGQVLVSPVVPGSQWLTP